MGLYALLAGLFEDGEVLGDGEEVGLAGLDLTRHVVQQVHPRLVRPVQQTQLTIAHSVKGFCHEMNIFFWKIVIINRYFSVVHALIGCTFFVFLEDEKIKLKVLACSVLKLLSIFENHSSNPLQRSYSGRKPPVIL